MQGNSVEQLLVMPVKSPEARRQGDIYLADLAWRVASSLVKKVPASFSWEMDDAGHMPALLQWVAHNGSCEPFAV